MPERRRKPQRPPLPEPPDDHRAIRQQATDSIAAFDIAARKLLRALNRYDQRERGR